ncbi:hypothetical protein [Roseovarius nanhaiticus]|uniref:hypothetical protein n=1 Tax=Roseovarius nanhaiticus TaxID=573024 RepID=UPI002492D541|nr:hypothetical protein [Roseovarius nanhaiticus]
MSTDDYPMATVQVDSEQFASKQRLAIYEIVNGMLNLVADIQATMSLRPEPAQIYTLIAISSAQKFVRAPNQSDFTGHTPLPVDMIGTVSRRRISDITGIPRETVARHVRHLMERGLVVETGVGKLATPPGVLMDLAPTGLPERMMRETVTLAQKLVRLKVLEIKVD